MFWFSIQFFSVTFLIPWRIQRAIAINILYTGLHVNYPLSSSYFNQTWILFTDLRKILKHQISWRYVQCERTDRHSHMTKLISRFSQNRFFLLLQTHTVSAEYHNWLLFLPSRFSINWPTDRICVWNPTDWENICWSLRSLKEETVLKFELSHIVWYTNLNFECLLRFEYVF